MESAINRIADWRRNEAICKWDSFGRKSIEVWGLNYRVTRVTDGVETLVVSQDEQEVWLRLVDPSPRDSKPQGKEEGDCSSHRRH